MLNGEAEEGCSWLKDFPPFCKLAPRAQLGQGSIGAVGQLERTREAQLCLRLQFGGISAFSLSLPLSLMTNSKFLGSPGVRFQVSGVENRKVFSNI